MTEWKTIPALRREYADGVRRLDGAIRETQARAADASSRHTRRALRRRLADLRRLRANLVYAIAQMEGRGGK